MLPIKFQLVFLLITIYLQNYYRNTRHLHTTQTGLYKFMLGFAYVVYGLEILEVLTGNGIFGLPKGLYPYSVRIFGLAASAFGYLLFLYAIAIVRETRRTKRTLLFFAALPLAFSVLITFFGGVEVVSDMNGVYARALITKQCAVELFYYLIVYVIYIGTRPKKYVKSRARSIGVALVWLSLAAVVQSVYPYAQLCSAGVFFILLVLLLRYENPAEFIDKEYDIFNQYAFRLVLGQQVVRRKSFKCIIVLIDNLGSEDNKRTIVNLDRSIRRRYEMDMFAVLGNCIGAFAYTPTEEKYFCNAVREAFGMRTNITSYDFPREFPGEKRLMKSISKQNEKADENKHFIDAGTGIYNRNAYEAYIRELDMDDVKRADIYCAVADLNHLKHTNDSYGHDMGDKLIATAARILEEAVPRDRGRVFRIGGDEFAIIIHADDDDEVKDILRKIELKRTKKSRDLPVPVEFSLGCVSYIEGEYIEDTIKRADKHMYENKKAYYRRGGFERRGFARAKENLDTSATQRIDLTGRHPMSAGEETADDKTEDR